MKPYPHAWAPSNFLGLAPEYSGSDNSAALLLPIPYEVTTSYKGGTKEGPRAIIEASRQVELYDREFGCEIACEYGIHTLPALGASFVSAELAIADIAETVTDLMSTGKLLGILGGEHAVSAGVARGIAQNYPNFITVQFDAHADLRDEYEGTGYSHACAARRIAEYSEIIQLGIRSVDVSEAEFITQNTNKVTTYFADAMQTDQSYFDRLSEKISGRNVYVTFDVDAFDPSIMPSTGTPEPGGLNWYTALNILRTISRYSRIIAFDCVELSPNPGVHAPDFMTAKLVYKLFSYAIKSQKR